jgi:hypothetical protein
MRARDILDKPEICSEPVTFVDGTHRLHQVAHKFTVKKLET